MIKNRVLFSSLLMFALSVASVNANIDGWLDSSKMIETVALEHSPKNTDIQGINAHNAGETAFHGSAGSLEISSIGDGNVPMLMAVSTSAPHEDIVTMAQTLGNNADKIIEFVQKNIKTEIYYGIKKGALLTLYEKSGNDYDKCVLTMELLKAAGVDENYYYSKMVDVVFLDNSHGLGNAMSLEDMLGVDVDFSIAANQTKVLTFLLSQNIPFKQHAINGKPAIELVRYKIFKFRPATSSSSGGFTLYDMSSYKKTKEDIVNIPEIAGINSSELLNAAGGTLDVGNRSIKSLNYSSLTSKLKEYSSVLSEYFSDNVSLNPKNVAGDVRQTTYQAPLNFLTTGFFENPQVGFLVTLESFYNKTIDQVISGYNPATDKAIQYTFSNGQTTKKENAIIYYKNVVYQNEYSKLNVYEGTSTSAASTKKLSEFNGERLWIYFDGDTGYLKCGDSSIYSKNVGSNTAWGIKFEVAHGYDHLFTKESNTTYDYPASIAKTKHAQAESFNKNNGFIYNIAYGFGATDILLAKRQEIYAKKLLAAKGDPNNFNSDGTFKISNNNLNNTQRDLLAEGLNVMGLTWLSETYKVNQIVANSFNCFSQYSHRIGKIAQERGFYLDVKLQAAACISKTYNKPDEQNSLHLSSIYASAFEHGVIQQLQDGVDAVSTVNALYYANSKGNPLVLINNASQTSSLSGYSQAEINSMKEFFTDNADGAILASKNRSCVPSEWEWQGYGYIGLSSSRAAMMISGGLNGGYGAYPSVYNPTSTYYGYSSSANYNYTNNTALYQNSYTTQNFSPSTYSSTTITKYTAADPVEMFSGSYIYDVDDLTVGDTLNFRRSYNSGLSKDSSGGLGHGWVHNYDMSATPRTAWAEASGSGTCEQMASFITSVHAAKSVFTLTPTNDALKAKYWATTSMIVKWGVDGMLDNCVSIKIGKESMQFVKQYKNSGADKTEYYAPPAGTNFVLEKDESGKFILKEPYGNKYTFNTSNKIESIETVFGKKTTFSYTDGKLTSISDPYGRSLTVTWADGNISSVSDGSRSVSYLYNGGNLTSCIDVLGKAWHYQYDAGNRMVLLKNPINGGTVVVETTYSDDGKVILQNSGGDPSKTWTLRYIGSKTEEIDPLNHFREYHYDSRGFCTKIVDQLGRSTSFEYDAHGRLLKKTMPETVLSQETDSNGRPVTTVKCFAIITDYDNYHNKTRERYVDLVEKREYVTDLDTNLTSLVSTVQSETVLSDVVFEYETPVEGYVPRLTKITKKALKEGEVDRVSTTTGYFIAGSNRTMLPTIQTDEKGIVTTTAYDSDGRIISETVGGRTTTFTNYDSYGNVGKITSPDLIPETYTYNSLGDMATSVSGGLTSEFTYDAKRRIIKTKRTGPGLLDPIVSELFYDDAGNLMKEVDPDGVITTYTWTSQQKKINETVGTGDNAQTTEYIYDKADRLIGTRMPDGRLLEYTLDAAGQKVEVKFAGKVVTKEYNELGKNTKITSPLGIEISKSYDGLGNKISETDGENNTVIYSYNSFGENTSIRNRRNGLFQMSTDISNRRSTVTTPMGRTTTTNYASETWDPLTITPASGSNNNTSFTYLSSGKVSRVTDGVGSISYTYNSTNGKVSTKTEGSSAISYGYDVLGRVTSSTSDNLTVNYSYTKGGKLKSITYPAQNGISAKTVNYEYDEFGRLSSITDWAGRITLYTYDDGNRLTRIIRPNGTQRTLEYDQATGNLLTITELDPDGSIIMVYNYNYDNDSRVKSISRWPKGAGAASLRKSFTATYNLDNQISAWNWQGMASMTPVYDANGNMTSGPINENTFGIYTYDKRNRLTSVGNTSYIYDCENNRTAVIYSDEYDSSEQYNYVYDRSGELSNVLIRNKVSWNKVSTYYVYGAGLNYEVTFDSNGAEKDVKYYHFDQLGSTIALTDKDGMVTDRFVYDDWGYSAHTIGDSDTPFLYVGLFGIQTDPNGLINMRARYYNPTTKTFITQDPSQFTGGLNWYAYASGNPISRIDRNGYFDGSVTTYTSQSTFKYEYSTGQYTFNTTSSVQQMVNTGINKVNYGQPRDYNVVKAGLGGDIGITTGSTALSFGVEGLKKSSNNYWVKAMQESTLTPKGMAYEQTSKMLKIGSWGGVGLGIGIGALSIGNDAMQYYNHNPSMPASRLITKAVGTVVSLTLAGMTGGLPGVAVGFVAGIVFAGVDYFIWGHELDE